MSEVEEFGATAWRLDRHDPWNHSLAMVLLGTPDSKGNAIAVAREGQIVVCGSTPTEADDRDMAIWGSKPGFIASFDLVYKEAHTISETAHDCAFVGETLVLAGDPHGYHLGEPNEYTRHVVLEYELDTKETLWTVAPIGQGPLVQSSAQAIAAMGNGGYVTAGHVCEHNCSAQLELRTFKLGGELQHTYRPAAKTTTATAVAWHPAGYAVVTAGELKGGWWSKMWVQA